MSQCREQGSILKYKSNLDNGEESLALAINAAPSLSEELSNDSNDEHEGS